MDFRGLAALSWANIINASFAGFMALLWIKDTILAWRHEEIVGRHWSPIAFYALWGIYCVVYFSLLHQPISAVAFGALTVMNFVYLFSYWILVGSFNYERPFDRFRWRILRWVRHIFKRGQ